MKKTDWTDYYKARVSKITLLTRAYTTKWLIKMIHKHSINLVTGISILELGGG